INTVRGLAIDRTTLQPLLGGGGGGLSGPAVKPAALHAVYHARAATGLPIVGLGGIAGAQDCIEFAAAGASVVALGTELFRNPAAVAKATADLHVLLARYGVSSFEDIVGRAHQSEYQPLLEVERNG